MTHPPDIDPDYLSITKSLFLAENEGARQTLIVGPFTMFVLLGVIQLGLRHPAMDGPNRRILVDLEAQVADVLVSGYKSDPQAAATLTKLIEDGRKPENDR